MSPKKKRAKKAPSAEAKKTPDGPFFRPFADLPGKAASKPEPASSGKPTPATPAKPKPAAPKRGRPQQEDPDELLTFERLMAGVKPLDDTRARRVPTSQSHVESGLSKLTRSQVAQAHEAAEREALAKLHALVEEGSRFEVQDDGRRIEGRRRGVDGGLVRRMRQGEIPVDATLDLQGMRGDTARQAVESFVRDRRARGDRVVVIVHGRGRASHAGQPVLRGEVAAWLSEGAASTHVSAFLTSPSEQGGEGAMSVLLAQAAEDHRGMR